MSCCLWRSLTACGDSNDPDIVIDGVDRDFFELGKSNADVEELHRKFLDELRWFTDIVDTLRVEDTIYKKETNV